ncbi:hypothetical protein [Photorhabdus sp. RM71S]|uniref:hypothetical protein n=1 Tax=Photorhabdus sp. RM71S TaxID=3342824 RepID=UPI0036DC7289
MSKLEEALMKYLNNSNLELRAGIFESATYPDGTPVATAGYINEYGAPEASIPPRPFFRTVIANGNHEWSGVLARGIKHYNGNAKQAMSALGGVIVDELQASVLSWTAPPNSPLTVAKKGFNKPLVETAQLSRSFSYEVNDD